MASRRRDDDRPLGRRAPTRQPKRRILIVCEGRVTERKYFLDFRHFVKNPRVHLEIAREHGVPKTVVETAIRIRDKAKQEAKHQRDDNLLWDEVWGVVDVDEHPNLEQAVALAKAQRIELAVSNPCFELWALLHFQEQRAHIERRKAREALQRHMPGYDKELNFASMCNGYNLAVTRAANLDQEAERDDERMRNPTTGVPRLTESIRRG
jgi:RloB-like protein